MALSEKTTNFKLNKPPFDKRTYHEDINDNADIIDALMARYIAVRNAQGLWQNSTAYTAGQTVVDADDGNIYECAVAHTSAATPTTFSADRTANPTYWTNATLIFANVGAWTTGTAYATGEFVTNDAKVAIVVSSHTSGTYATDVTNGLLVELVDLTDEIQEAEDWASKTGAAVEGSNYSAKEYAIGSTEAVGGSAKAWASTAEDVTVPGGGGEFSAKHYSEKAQDALNQISPNTKFDATTSPTANNDSVDTAGLGTTFSVGSLWIDVTADEVYRCVDDTATAAVWVNTSLTLTDLGTIVTQNANSVALTGGTIASVDISGGTIALTSKQRRYTTRIWEKGNVSEADDVHVITFRRAVRLHNIDASTTDGSVTVDLKKNGANIGGINGVSVTTTQTETAVNDSSNAYIDFAAGDTLTIDKSSVVSATDLEIFLDIEER